MISITRDTVIPSVDQVIDILTDNNRRLGIPLDVDRMLEYHAIFTIKGHELRRRIERYVGWSSISDLTAADFKGWLKLKGFDKGLLSTGGGDISLDADSVKAAISTGQFDKEISTLLTMYASMSSMFSKISLLAKILDNNPIVPVPTYDNHRMMLVKPRWVAQNTGRVAMQNPALQNIAKEIADIRTHPKGWVYIDTDSGQIEPRIIQSAYIGDPQIVALINAYNDAYFGYIHYCKFLTAEDIRSGRTDFQVLEKNDDMMNYRKKFKTFGNASMYGSTENAAGDPDKAVFIERIGRHPLRLKWQYDIEQAVERGQYIFETKFGTPIDCSKSVKLSGLTKGSREYNNQLSRLALNNPVQATAADLMRVSVAKANFLLRRKAPNSVITEYKHDSGAFLIHEDDYDAVAPEIKTITSYEVPGWIPIYSDPVEGIKNTSGMARLF